MIDTQYNKSVAITPSDTVDFMDGLTDAIYIGGAGIAQVVQQDGTVGAFTCVAGQILPIKAKRVNATSGTATLMRALYQV